MAPFWREKSIDFGSKKQIKELKGESIQFASNESKLVRRNLDP
jgi:hypothetical protein